MSYIYIGLPWWLKWLKKKKNLLALQETWVQSLSWEDPLEEEMSTYSSILAWRIPMDRRAWQAIVHGITKSQTGLSDIILLKSMSFSGRV